MTIWNNSSFLPDLWEMKKGPNIKSVTKLSLSTSDHQYSDADQSVRLKQKDLSPSIDKSIVLSSIDEMKEAYDFKKLNPSCECKYSECKTETSHCCNIKNKRKNSKIGALLKNINRGGVSHNKVHFIKRNLNNERKKLQDEIKISAQTDEVKTAKDNVQFTKDDSKVEKLQIEKNAPKKKISKREENKLETKRTTAFNSPTYEIGAIIKPRPRGTSQKPQLGFRIKHVSLNRNSLTRETQIVPFQNSSKSFSTSNAYQFRFLSPIISMHN
jgi:hypothetical protein